MRSTARDLREAEQGRAAGQAAQRQAAERVRAAQADEKRLAEARVAAALRLREIDLQAAEAASRVEALSTQQRDAETRLAERAAAITPMLPLAVRLSLFPAETLLAAPAPPEAGLRGLLVLRGLARQAGQDAAALRADADEVTRLKIQVERGMAGLRTVQAEQSRRAAELDRQLAASRETARQAEDARVEAARRTAAQAARAETLRGVLAQLEAERDRQEAAAARRQRETEQREETRRQAVADAAPPAPPAAPTQAARTDQAPAPQRPAAASMATAASQADPAGAGRAAAFASPVAGTVLRGWGERTDGGPANGLSYRAPPGARVVAPCAGRVAFASAFRSFGPMVILDCGGGYHMVLAGLDRLDVQVGHPVQTGEPVGVMAGWDPRSAGTSGTAPPSLYVELRRGGEPLNPAPFLRAAATAARG